MKYFNISSALRSTGDASSNVTSLTITPSDPSSGDTVTMDLTFADKNGDIKPGNTIDVNWPTTGDAYLSAYNQSFPLIDPKSGLTLANVVVTNGKATITFTNDITKLQNITGNVKFKATAWNVTAGDTEDKKTINVTCGTKSTSLTITKPGSSGEKADFFSKTGSIWANDPDHVTWYLNTNVEKENVLEPINITDQLQPGQDLVPADFTIYNSSGTDFYTGVTAIEDFEKAHPGCSVSYNQSSGLINIQMDPATVNGTNWIFIIKTKITDASKKTFDNNSSIDYWPEGSPEPKHLDSNASVENPYADGGISGVPVGTLMIKKFLEDSNGTLTDIPVEGVKFKLVRSDGGDITPGQTSIIITTNAQGEAKIENLPDGSYELTEISSLNWLNPIQGPITINVDSGTGEGVLKKIGNTKKTIDVTGNKSWNSSVQTHPTIWFKLYRSIASGPIEAVPNQDVKELPSGTTSVTWTGLDYSDNSGNIYTYSVKEVNAQGQDYTPVGYDKTESGLNITNKIQTTAVTVNKVWVDDNNQDGIRPASVTVSLTEDGTILGTPVTISGSTWTHTWSDLPEYKDGKKITYSVTEEPIDGYQSTVSPIDNGVITLTNTHTPGKTSLTVNKTWVDDNNQDGIRPTSVTVSLTEDGTILGTPVTISGSTWTHTWSDLPEYKDGKKITYSVTEEPIDGYQSTVSPVDNGVITLTNTHTPGKTSLTVNKTWVDDNNQDGIRPASITVSLTEDGTVLGTPVTISGSTWSHTWADLPEYKDGKKITYSVTEEPIDGYQSTVSPIDNGVITLTNTHTPSKTSVTVNKTWVDDNNQDGIRPASVTVSLTEDGTILGTPVTISGSTWTHTWSDLPEYKDGKKITYSVTEEPIDGYLSTVSPIDNGVITLTNTHTPGKTSLTVNKVWIDDNNQDGIRPTSVTVSLTEDGAVLGTAVTVSGSTWSHTWSDLPLYKDGKKITYSVTEEPIDGYQSTVSPIDNGVITLTNTHTPGKTSLTVNKVWIDDNNQDGIRPTSVTVSLTEDGAVLGTPVTISGSTWNHTWSDLPEYKDGKKITYSVTEEPIDGYQSTVSPIDNGVITLTNTHTPEKTSLTVNKVWLDNNNQDGIRPDKITVSLHANGLLLGSSVQINTSTLTHTWDNLPLYKDGKKIIYTITEEPVNGYKSTISTIDNGVITLTNTHTPEKTSITVNKVWVDVNNQDGIRPASITVSLTEDGTILGTPVTISGSTWSHTWSDLPEYKDGKKIIYSITEEPIDGYQSTVSSIDNGVITLTNTHTPGKTSLTVNKFWIDDNNQDGIRPTSVAVSLTEDGAVLGTPVTVSGSTWSHTWSDLPEYKDGKKITYSVTEEPIDGYQSTVSPIDNGVITLTNTHTPEKTSLTVNKVWLDNNNQDGIRPDKITVSLHANGLLLGSSVQINTSTLTHTWDNLPLYKDGKKIIYTIIEEPVNGYKSTISAIDNGVITLTNAHIPAKTSLTVNKVWVDNNNQDGIRPTSVTVSLNSDGVVVGTPVTVSGSTWNHTWSDLPEYKDGKKITYSVTEEPIDGYQSTVSPIDNGVITLTNTHTPEKTSLTVNKVWLDNNNQDGIRPDKITVSLNSNGSLLGSSVQINTSTLTHTWDNLPLYKDGKKIIYTITEEPVNSYKSTISAIDNGVITLTNTHIPAKTSLTINKVWVDNNNQDGIRPANITVYLNADGLVLGNPVQISTSILTHTWTDLPEYKDGKKITYSVTESPVNGYQSSISSIDNGIITLTNTHTPKTTPITVNKVWADNNNHDGIRPDKIIVSLTANGIVVGNPVELNGSIWTPTWTYTWFNLPEYKDGKKITYSVIENSINGYHATISIAANGVITLTNTHTVCQCICNCWNYCNCCNCYNCCNYYNCCNCCNCNNYCNYSNNNCYYN